MPTCQACNKFKSNKTITVFRKQLLQALSSPKTMTDFIIRVKYRDQEDINNLKFFYEREESVEDSEKNKYNIVMEDKQDDE